MPSGTANVLMSSNTKLKTRHKRHEQTPTRLKGLDPPPLDWAQSKGAARGKQNNTGTAECNTAPAVRGRSATVHDAVTAPTTNVRTTTTTTTTVTSR